MGYYMGYYVQTLSLLVTEGLRHTRMHIRRVSRSWEFQFFVFETLLPPLPIAIKPKVSAFIFFRPWRRGWVILLRAWECLQALVRVQSNYFFISHWYLRCTSILYTITNQGRTTCLYYDLESGNVLFKLISRDLWN